MHDYDLDIKTAKTSDGLFNVDYYYISAPYDEQVTLFSANGLHVVSPAEKAYLSCDKNLGKIFSDYYSRTDMDSLTIPETEKVALVKNGLLSNLFGVQNIVEAHRNNTPFMIKGAKNPKFRDDLYARVNLLEKNGLAFIVEGGNKTYTTTMFDEEAPVFMFSDSRFMNNAKNYCQLVLDKGRSEVTWYLDDKASISGYTLPVLNKVRVWGPCDGLDINSSSCRGLDDNNLGAFGVRFTPIKK